MSAIVRLPHKEVASVVSHEYAHFRSCGISDELAVDRLSVVYGLSAGHLRNVFRANGGAL